MQIRSSIQDNLQFLSAEADGQVKHLQEYLESPTPELALLLLGRRGYAENLKTGIQAGCTESLAAAAGSEPELTRLRSKEAIALELDGICALVRDCVEQVSEIRDRRCLEPETCQRMLQRVSRGIVMAVPALQGGDTRRALKIGEINGKLGRLFARLQKHYVKALRENQHTEDLVRALFVAHAVERMGNALLNISEAILSCNLGRSFSLERYHSLQSSLEALDEVCDLGVMELETLAETRSGGSVAGISRANQPDDAYLAIFKGGGKRKLKEERVGVENWHEIYPGLAPRVISYQKHGESASMLIEHLPGLTFEQVLVQESPDLSRHALKVLTRTLKSVWSQTRRNEPVNGQYMGQLQKRLDEVYRIHPEFRRGEVSVCGCAVRSFDTLVAEARQFEAQLDAPYSVYIHGDFNVDNIIFDPDEQRINFIDLHRSCYMDYVQDVSVFMVSNYRLQILDRVLRQRMMQVARDLYRTARRQAQRTGDDTFELRMALGLARSFATSTRFILDKSLARNMFLRARYLLERVLETGPSGADAFRLQVRELFVG